MRGASFLKRNLLKVPFNIPIRETAARNPFIYAASAGGWENARNLLGKRKEPFFYKVYKSHGGKIGPLGVHRLNEK